MRLSPNPERDEDLTRMCAWFLGSTAATVSAAYYGAPWYVCWLLFLPGIAMVSGMAINEMGR